MPPSAWEDNIKPLQELITQPIRFNDLSITLLDAIWALHSRDWSIETHRHPWYEFNYVSEGALYTTIEGCEFLTAAGHFYLIPPGTYHSHRYCNHEGDNGFCLRWQLERISFPGETENISALGARIMEVLSIPRPFCTAWNAGELIENASKCSNIAVLQSEFLRWLLSLYELWEDKGKETTYEHEREKALVQQAILFLSEYYASDIPVQDLANSINISYRHLARIFKQVTGLTIVEKLNDIRVYEAKKLLKDTDKTIREIAREVGFENEYYFSNTFTHRAYTSPSKFRKRFRE
jgi:AraC family transcriptional regulator, transcriptional activator of pobA